MVEKPGKLQPALIGGVITGLGSIIPFLAYGNLCCCVWAIIGGAVAARLLIKRSARPVTKSEGAFIGLLAGAVGSLIYLAIGTPITLMGWDAFTAAMLERSDTIADSASRESFKQAVVFMQNHALLSSLLIWLIFAILSMGFAALGGVIGVSIFEKRKGQPFPPQWPPPPEGYPPPGFAPPSPPPGGPIPPPGQAPYGGGEPPY